MPNFPPYPGRRRLSESDRLALLNRARRVEAVNREAQITTVLILGFAFAFLGWAIVYLSSAPIYPHKDDATRSPFRRWLAAATHRLLKARE
jgi:hypothetical protein